MKIKIEKFVRNGIYYIDALYSDWFIKQYVYYFLPSKDDIEKIKRECEGMVNIIKDSEIDKYPATSLNH